MKVIATNLGSRKKVNWKGRLIETGIFKSPVSSILLDREMVEKDQVIDRSCHAGTNKAVYVYSTDHYPYWKERFPDLQWNYGMFGENLSIEGLDEKNIHIGNRYRVGGAIIEATESRDPCVKLGMRFEDAKIIKQFWNTTKCGVYFKVIQPGEVKSGDFLILLEEKSTNPSIAEVYKSDR